MSIDWFDDFDDDGVPADSRRCPECEEVWPKSYFETDSGLCISCEDAEGEDY